MELPHGCGSRDLGEVGGERVRDDDAGARRLRHRLEPGPLGHDRLAPRTQDALRHGVRLVQRTLVGEQIVEPLGRRAVEVLRRAAAGPALVALRELFDDQRRGAGVVRLDRRDAARDPAAEDDDVRLSVPALDRPRARHRPILTPAAARERREPLLAAAGGSG
jgi:hypothetical protein